MSERILRPVPGRSMVTPGIEPARSDDSVKVLYIVGAGRSGSTILEMILGNLQGFVSVGEVRYLWEYLELGDRLCGCGERLGQCDFWKETLRLVNLAPGELQELARASRELDRTGNALFLVAGVPRRRQFPPPLIDATLRLYRAILAAGHASTVIDSSKVPSHLELLLRIHEADVRALHLVRDPRAYVYSETAHIKIDPTFSGTAMRMGTRPAIPATMAWAIENYLASFLGPRAEHYAVMRYETFTSSPDEALGQALHVLGLDYAPRELLRSASLVLRPTHSVGGNPLRFNKGPLTIRESREWSRAMAPGMQRLLGLILFPLMAKYGYDWTPGRSE